MKVIILISLIAVFSLVICSCRKDTEKPVQKSNSISLNSVGSWHDSSIPLKFGESGLTNDTRSGMNRSLVSWYNIDASVFYDVSSNRRPPNITMDDLSDPYARVVFQDEVFPSKYTAGSEPMNIPVFNISYYPVEKGSWNFDILPTPYSSGIDAAGKLLNPASRWGGLTSNLEGIEIGLQDTLVFWLMDPFIGDNSIKGELYFDFGDISEDVLKDESNEAECNLGEITKTTVWGQVGLDTSLTGNFSVYSRKDYGLDGIDDTQEVQQFADYLAAAGTICSQEAMEKMHSDPSGDNYHHYTWKNYDDLNYKIPERYKRVNGTEGNSPEDNDYEMATRLPDIEDINHNGMLDTQNNYYEYKVDISKTAFSSGSTFISEIRTATDVLLQNGMKTNVKWYCFKIPLSQFAAQFGNPMTSSFHTCRIFLTGFSTPVVLRFATLEIHLHDYYIVN